MFQCHGSLLIYYAVGHGDEWGPMILNSQEELDTSLQTYRAEILSNCENSRAFIGGRSNNSDNWNDMSVPSYYIPSDGGKHKVIVTLE